MYPSFTLLDDSQSSTAESTSRLYTDLQQVLCCTDAVQFEGMIEQMQVGLRQGLYAVAVWSYELGLTLTPSIPWRNDETESWAYPKAADKYQPSTILLYKQCQKLSQQQVTNWLKQQTNNQADQIAGIADLRANITEEEFTRAIHRIQRYVADGDTYQVNYTFRFHFQTYGDFFSLYQRLRERQPVPFGALIAMPDGSVILSLSPELFIRHSKGRLFAQPMKGTIAASINNDEKLDEKINEQLSECLALDQKNRAENVMIVDLLRNDLGRIAQPGSIQVPHLFEVQRFNTVLQMTSSVTAQCREEVNLVELIKAVYPCGSVTGAPKIRTMQIIHELETEVRGVYTGAIGWFDPIKTNEIPEFCLSVPIRTLHLQTPASNGTRQSVLGVGAGIVFDSIAASEYQECLLKARFLTELPAPFSLFETMYATKEDGCRYWSRHLRRLKKSADYFGMPLNVPQIEQQLKITCAEFVDAIAYRVKLSVNGAGQIQIQSAVLAALETPVKVALAPTKQQSNNLWLQHKTTNRLEYDQAWQIAENQGAFDMMFCNERGEVTEGGRSNLLVKFNGRWYTPPLTAGVLPGVMRSVLMDDPTWRLTERSIQLDELKRAEEIAVCNALRGVLPVANFTN